MAGLFWSIGYDVADQAKALAEQRYEDFDARRRSAEARIADAEDVKLLEEIEQQAKSRKG